MKIYYHIALFLSIFTPPVQARTAVFTFTDGSSLTGEIITSNGKQTTISSPSMQEPSIIIDNSHLLQATFPPSTDNSKKPSNTTDYIALLTLSDRYSHPQRDLAKGKIKAITKDSVTLQTTSAGDLTIDRSLLHSINIRPLPLYSYSGPNSLEEWTQYEAGTWQYHQGRLLSSAQSSPIGLDAKFTEKSILSFSIDWRTPTHRKLKIYLYASSLDHPDPDSYYLLSLSPYARRCQMSRYGKNDQTPHTDLEQSEHAHSNTPLSSAHYTLYMDKKNGVFHLFESGKKLYTFTQRTPTKTHFGTAMLFENNQDLRIRLNKLKVRSWNGLLPNQKSELSETQLKAGKPHIILANGDEVTGTIKRVSNNVLEVATPYTPIQIPLKVTSQIQLDAQMHNQARAEPNDIKAYYNDGGWIRINVSQIDTEHIHGSNEAFGDALFKLSSFKKIEWHPYSQEHAILRATQSR